MWCHGKGGHREYGGLFPVAIATCLHRIITEFSHRKPISLVIGLSLAINTSALLSFFPSSCLHTHTHSQPNAGIGNRNFYNSMHTLKIFINRCAVDDVNCWICAKGLRKLSKVQYIYGCVISYLARTPVRDRHSIANFWIAFIDSNNNKPALVCLTIPFFLLHCVCLLREQIKSNRLRAPMVIWTTTARCLFLCVFDCLSFVCLVFVQGDFHIIVDVSFVCFLPILFRRTFRFQWNRDSELNVLMFFFRISL